MNKKTLKLMGDLNNVYDEIWNFWIHTKKWSVEFHDYAKKLKLVNVVTRNIKETAMWFLKTTVKYSDGWRYILEHSQDDYESLYNEVSKIMLGI